MSNKFTGRQVMGAIESLVTLVTAAFNGDANVTTVSMITGLSFKPPIICVSLSKHSFSKSLIDKSNELAVNIVSPDQLELVKKVGASTGHNIDKFKEFDIETFDAEAISCPLIKTAHTILECKVDKAIDIGKQILYIAEVIAYHELSKKSPIYLYHGKYYTLGDQIGTY